MKKLTRYLLVVAVLLSIPTLAYGQGVYYTGNLRSTQGTAVAGANVAVCTTSSDTTHFPCSSAAAIYSNEALTTTKTNPFTTSSTGEYGFWAAPGHYIIQLYGAGITNQVINVILPCGPGSSCTVSKLNGIYMVGGSTYPCTATGINAAISAAISSSTGTYKGGVVDARACTGDVTMSAPILVGDTSGDAVTLLLPVAAVWTINGRGSRVCDLEQFGNTRIVGQGNGFGTRFRISPASGTAPYATYCTYGALVGHVSSDYYYLQGVQVYNNNAVTTTSGFEVVIGGAADSSRWDNLTVGSYVNGGILLFGNCCGVDLWNPTVNLYPAASGPALQLGNGRLGNVNVALFGGTFNERNVAQPNIYVDAKTYTDGPIYMHSPYMETNTRTAKTSPFVEIGTNGLAHGLYLFGATFWPTINETVDLIQVVSGANHTALGVYGGAFNSSVSIGNAINDRRHRVVVAGANYGRIPDYSTQGPQSGTATLTSGTAKITFSPAFAATPGCTANDTTAANAVRVEPPTSSSVKFDGTSGDKIIWRCWYGRN